tara:strand:+ start:23885 stop:24718 length:834 start_codon:yes stop_codon:yes gene_type:complete
MNILSIDVGMKNLAICLFNITDELHYKIKIWDVVNLCNETNYCCGEINKKTNKTCNKKAKFTKNNKYYCKIHAKNKDFKIPPPELNVKKIKKLKIIKLKELAKKYDIEFEKKIKKDDLQKIILNKLDIEYFNNISSVKTNDFNLVQYGRNLKKEFNNIFKNIQIDGVVIENQIGPLAMRMKTLQGMIMQHFIEKNIPLVEEVSASNKLKEFLGNKKTTYSERKKESIIITRNILNENNYLSKWLEVFDKHKKKDDLADSFLQGRWYLKNTILKEKIE